MEKSTFPKDFWIMCRFRPSLTKSRILLLASQTSWKLMLSKFSAIHILWFIFRARMRIWVPSIAPITPKNCAMTKKIRPVLSVQLYRKGYETSNNMRPYRDSGQPVNYSRYSGLINDQNCPHWTAAVFQLKSISMLPLLLHVLESYNFWLSEDR